MARYVTPEVKTLLDQADSGEDLNLAIVPAEGASEELYSRLHEFNIDAYKELPSGILLITGSAAIIEEFIDTPLIDSVSEPNRMTVM